MGRSRSDAAAGGPAEEALLGVLARFGYARPAQVARLLRADPRATLGALQRLEARGLVHPVLIDGRPEAVGLTPAGARRLPALLPKQRVAVGHAAATLAAVDLACAVEARGTDRWLSWCEAVRAGLALPEPGRGLPPAEGVILPGARGATPPHPHRVPACVVLRDPGRRALRARLLRAVQATGASEVRIFAPASLVPDLRGHLSDLPCAVAVEPLAAAPARRPGPRRAPAGGPGAPLTEKRARVLRLLAAFGYATVDQVARMQGTRPTAASIMLAALERRGLVARHRQHHLHKDVYSPTAEGLAAVGSPLPPVPRVPVQRRHALALVDLAHDLAAETGGRWETQRELAHAGLGAGGRAPHGRLHLPDGRRVAVRLELSSQPRHTVLELAARQLGAGQCQEVWFVVAPEWERRYAARLEGRPGVAVRPWAPPDRLGGPRGFRADSAGREGRTALPAR